MVTWGMGETDMNSEFYEQFKTVRSDLPSEKIGILLINLGTPDSFEVGAVKRYLREFLSDWRVIERKGLAWWFLLNGVIIPRRAPKSSRAYQQVWNHDLNESPLLTITRAQADRLAQRFDTQEKIMVDWAMRYGNPTVEGALLRLSEAGCARVLVFPLYPQYSAATTGSAMDRVFAALGKMRHQPTLRVVPPYYREAAYIDSVADGIRKHLQSLTWKPEMCVASFHGLPEAFVARGDPYREQCEETVARLRERLAASTAEIPLVYQSRGGRGEWIGPHLEEFLIARAREGVKTICVVTPGFSADCVETLEEVGIRAKRAFLENGGEEFSVVPCLNDSEKAIDLLQNQVERELRGWLD